MSPLLSFHNDAAVKTKYVDRVKAHAAADRLVQGVGWEEGKGCAVGCTFENYDHSRGPIEIGVPEWLMRLEDKVFEGLPKSDAMQWPVIFLEAIPVGVDLDPLRHKLAILRAERNLTILTNNKENYAIEVRAAIGAIIEYHKNSLVGFGTARSAESAAESAARSAESAAWSAAWSAESAAWSAESAAWSAASAAWSAASAVENFYKAEAADLLKLLRECK